MKDISEIINYVIALVQDIKNNTKDINIGKNIIDFIGKDQIPYTGMLHKESDISKNLEIIVQGPNSNIVDEIKQCMIQYPVIISDGNPGSHVSNYEAVTNNNVMFMLGLVTTALVHQE